MLFDIPLSKIKHMSFFNIQNVMTTTTTTTTTTTKDMEGSSAYGSCLGGGD
jgi:hypothetical protein